MKVGYWHALKPLTMKAWSSGMLTASYKLGHSGKWRAAVAFAGSSDYASSTSATKSFSAK